MEKVLFDILSYYLIRVDLKKGHTCREYAIRRRNERILAKHGDRIRKEYEQLTKENDIDRALSSAIEQTGASMTCLPRQQGITAIRVVYRDRRNKGPISYMLVKRKRYGSSYNSIVIGFIPSV